MADDLKMINYIESGHRAESLKQKAIANNVANMHTTGYRRFDVKFEEILAEAVKRDKKVGMDDLKGELFRPMNGTVNSNGNDVSLEEEVTQMVQNSTKHKAYTLLLKKKYQHFDLATKV